MALVPCRECAKEISDQAEVCPNCGIKEPAGGVAAVLPPAQERPDEVILTMANVVVTRTLAKFKSQTFPINGIGSVTLVAPKASVLMIIFGVVLGIFCFFAFSADEGGFGLFLLVCSGGLFFGAFSKQHGLFIKTASGDVRAMEGDEKTLETVKQAIERAATMRG